jgi:integrase
MTILTLAPRPDTSQSKDRLDLLTELINAQDFDPLLRSDVISLSADHPAFQWACIVPDCARPRTNTRDLCQAHLRQFHARPAGLDRAGFLRTAEPFAVGIALHYGPCIVCPGRPAVTPRPVRLCKRHHHALRDARRNGRVGAIEDWVAAQNPHPTYGRCRCRSCDDLAASPLGLCRGHDAAFLRAGAPGGAALPGNWWMSLEHFGLPVPILCQDRAEFDQWCATANALYRPGQINLLGLRPLLQAELRWGLFAHIQERDRTAWGLSWINQMVNLSRPFNCLADLDASTCRHQVRLMVQEMRNHLRPVYFSQAASREAGFVDGRHFGFRFRSRRGYFDLTDISQRWLRDLLWDRLTDRMRSPQAARSASPYDHLRRAARELSAFLEARAPQGGHDPALLREEHMASFVADQRTRAREALPSLGITLNGAPTTVTETTRRFTFNYGRMLLRPLLETNAPEELGLDRKFITALPTGGFSRGRTRSPFTDEVARALADPANLEQLVTEFDRHDRGARDIWQIMIVTGRRSGEVIDLRLDCIGTYNGLPLLWHDQTKVGKLDESVRIPDYIYDRIRDRQRKTLAWFEERNARPPTRQERASMALFPSIMRNPTGVRAVSIQWFHNMFRGWIEQMDMGGWVPHQARHTIATALLDAGASIAEVRDFLGHLSIAMTEHYGKIAKSKIEDVLQHVWVAGPGAARPGELLSAGTSGMTRADAEALAIDLSRRSTPAEGGFCTFQTVVNGQACPWNLDCEHCTHFVLSGADLLYWLRKREQWQSIAERAPDDATADYLHKVFEPTAAAIRGLEDALKALGLLQDALSLDMRRPQDYLHRLWSISFRSDDLARRGDARGATDDRVSA